VSPELKARRSGSRWERAKSFLAALFADFGEGELLTYASAIAFGVLFAVIPLALFATALVGFLEVDQLWTVQLAPRVRATVGDPGFAAVDATVRQVLLARQGFWLTFGLGLTILALSSAVRATAGAFQRIYNSRDERSFLRHIGVTLVLGAAVGACLLVAALAIFVGASTAAWLLGPSAVASVVGFVARWAAALGAMLLAIGLLLRYAPGERVAWRWVGTGAIVTVIVWALASAGFRAYVSYVVNYGSVFGSLAVPFVTLLYLYIASLALLFGVWVERRERTGADRPMQSPPDESEADEEN
jgi:membrane protein